MQRPLISFPGPLAGRPLPSAAFLWFWVRSALLHWVVGRVDVINSPTARRRGMCTIVSSEAQPK
jgi:hypothetical protein